MSNAELFKKVFGIYAEEFWAYSEEKMLDWLTSDVSEMEVGDTIYRQAAIEALISFFGLSIEGEYGSAIQEVLNGLPSARKKGKWIEYNATGKKQWMCSECCVEEKNPKVARFCYWCGADMRGEDDVKR